MNSVFTKKQEKQLQEIGVNAIYLFGSRATGHATELSDYDYAILTKDSGHFRGDDLYNKLYPILCDVSPRTLKNDIIDIVFLKDTGLELRFHVIRYGKVLYDTNPSNRLDFEAQTTLLYCDFKPVLNEIDQAILDSI
ncbi:MAG: nucleotidyltransferase domain-containing protein [Deltaproteobacteria bacterium]|nr:nucleotidyltransferase domain-containing protein [Deltaproteobacteria bacterium]